MAIRMDEAVEAFLGLGRIAVVGVSRGGRSPANAIAKRLRETAGPTGRAVFAINPSGAVIDGEPTFTSVDAVEGGVDGVVVVTNPARALEVVPGAARAGAKWIWFHQGFGPVSYDDQVLAAARAAGLGVIAAGCPMMYVAPDGFHRCARGVFRWFGRIPAEIPL